MYASKVKAQRICYVSHRCLDLACCRYLNESLSRGSRSCSTTTIRNTILTSIWRNQTYRSPFYVVHRIKFTIHQTRHENLLHGMLETSRTLHNGKMTRFCIFTCAIISQATHQSKHHVLLSYFWSGSFHLRSCLGRSSKTKFKQWTISYGQTNKRFSAISPRWKGSTSISAVSRESFIPFFAFRSIHTKSSAAISVTAKQKWSFVRAWKHSYRTSTPVYEELNVKTSPLPIYTRQDSNAHRSQSYFDLHRVPSRQVFCIRSFLCENPCMSEFLFSSSSSSSNSTLSISSSLKGNASDAMAKQIMVRKSRMAGILFIVFYVYRCCLELTFLSMFLLFMRNII